MAKTKYPISKEFFPFNHLTFSFTPERLDFIQKHMGPPASLWRNSELHVETHVVPAYQDGEIEVIVLTPRGIAQPAPCFVDIHGGGFVLDAAPSHYRMAAEYAKGANCIVAFVRYRLAPAYPFPFPHEDCYIALNWVHDHAEDLGIDRARIGIGGDSAGGTLTVTSCMMARDRNAAVRPLFQLLIYPWLDDRNVSESYHKYTDTPMWNSSLSKQVGPLINPDPSATPLAYRSPVEAESLAALPPAYIEVAEFDCLHDDGVYYAELLRKEGISVEFHETHGTMHGFDTKTSAPTSRKMVAARIAFMNKMFAGHLEVESC